MGDQYSLDDILEEVRQKKLGSQKPEAQKIKTQSDSLNRAADITFGPAEKKQADRFVFKPQIKKDAENASSPEPVKNVFKNSADEKNEAPKPASFNGKTEQELHQKSDFSDYFKEDDFQQKREKLSDSFTRVMPASEKQDEKAGSDSLFVPEEKEFLEERKKKLDTFTVELEEIELKAEEPVQLENAAEETTKPDEKEESIDDYTTPEDAKYIMQDLKNLHKELLTRFSAILVGSLILLYLSLSKAFSLPSLELFNPVSNPQIYLATHFIVLLISILICNKTVGGGLVSLFTFHADNDSLCTVGLLTAVAQCVSLVVSPDHFVDSNIQVFAPIAELALLFNCAGKLLVVSRIAGNFRLVGSSYPKYAVSLLEEKEQCRQFTRGLSLEIADVSYSCPADFLSSFLAQSYSDDFSENVSRVLAPLSFFGSIVVAVLTYFFTRDLYIAFTALAAIGAICSPFSASLVSSYPLNRVSKKLVKSGAFLSGYEAVDNFSETKAVILDASELFGPEDIVLHSVKTFDNKRIDEALLDAASVICSCHSTISGVFDEVVSSNKAILKKVESLAYENGMGISAWVDSKRILIGNRELMQHHGIRIPPLEYEQRFQKEGKDVLYLSNSGEVSAMFVLGYRAGKAVKRALSPLADRNVALLVYSTDPNLTSEKLGELFDYPEDLVKILPAELHSEYETITSRQERKTAGLGYTGGIVSYLKGIYGSMVARMSITAGTIIQMIGVILAYAIVVFFAFNRSMQSISFVAVLAYQLFWLLAVLGISNLKRIK